MSRILAVTGVHLDRAWGDLGPQLGQLLREWSPQVLADAVDAARRLNVDQMLVLGDLFDRASTLPATVEVAAAILGSLEAPVLVVPGPGDWSGEGSPYSYGEWPGNVHVVTSAALTPDRQAGDLWASGWTSPVPRTLAIPSELSSVAASWVARPGVAEPATLADQLPDGVHLITTGSQAAHRETHTVLAPLTDPYSSCAQATLLGHGQDGVVYELVDLAPPPVRTQSLDVSGFPTEKELQEAILTVAPPGEPTCVRLTGSLPAAVLPPSHHDVPLPDHVVIDETALEYPVPTADPDDRTTQAEFLRSMAGVTATARERHIATALGLQALTATGG